MGGNIFARGNAALLLLIILNGDGGEEEGGGERGKKRSRIHSHCPVYDKEKGRSIGREKKKETASE